MTDRTHTAVPAHRYTALGDSILEVRQDPRFDLLVEGGAEVRQRDARSRAPEFQRGFGGRIPAPGHDDILLERVMTLSIGVVDMGEVLPWHTDEVRRTPIARRHDDCPRGHMPGCNPSFS